MSLRRSPLVWLNGVLVVVALLWLWLAPRRAWGQFVTAAERGTDDELMAMVDVPGLSNNFRSDIRLALQSRGAAMPEMAGSGQEGLITSFTEAAVAPGGIRETLRSFQQGDASGNVATSAATSFRYLSPIAVQVRLHQAGAPATDAGLFTFRFSGTRWRLVRIQSGWLVEKERS